MISRRDLLTAAMVGCALGPGACSDATDFGELFEVRNTPDTFEFVVSELRGYTRTHEYGWSNSGASVRVYQSTAITAGSARLIILDATGAEVYDRSLADNGTFPGVAGSPGPWLVRVVFTGASGAIIFRVDAAPAPSGPGSQ